MSQYSTGLASTTNGSPTVTGTNTLWLANVSAADSFTIAGDGVMYDVASVDSDTQITLSVNYAGVTASGAVYAIGTGFTVPDSFPEMSQGDIETATIFTRAMRKIQGKFSSILAGGANANFTAMPQVGNSPLVEPATTTQIGTVEKATTTEAKEGTADKFPDAAGVHAAFNQYGLGGSAPSLLDVDDMVTPGTFGGPGDSGVNFPGETEYGVLRVSGRHSSLLSQEAMYGGDQYYMRYTNDGGATWTNWEQIYHTGMTPDFPNMPQVGGDPIVESGSNADGEWTRWSDGSQVCWHTLADRLINQGSDGGVYYSLLATWVYPKAFTAVPSASERTQKTSSLGSVWSGSGNAAITTTQMGGIVALSSNGSQSGISMVTAHGRWQ